jgi:hypothetical protein
VAVEGDGRAGLMISEVVGDVGAADVADCAVGVLGELPQPAGTVMAAIARNVAVAHRVQFTAQGCTPGQINVECGRRRMRTDQRRGEDVMTNGLRLIKMTGELDD